MPRRFLVTGGAGYVGSHLVAALCDRGDTAVVLDNLSIGHRQAVPDGVQLIEADLADATAIDAVLKQGPWDAVFHFAALSQVGESMREPLRYLMQNAGNGMRLIDACVRHGVGRFVLSSTAALFNATGDGPIPEDAPIDPNSAYGDSKWMIERALRWASEVHGLRHACLRYFNAAGADPKGRLGEDHRPETHLMPLAIDAALGRRPPLTVFGDDYPTPDGTCIRDYIHVTDLAHAHIAALTSLFAGGPSATYNVGTGFGYSVREVLDAVESVTGHKVPCVIGPRREGDPPALVADSTRLRSDLDWTPRHSDLKTIVQTAWAWARRAK